MESARPITPSIRTPARADALDGEHADVPAAMAVADQVEAACRVPEVIGIDLAPTGLAAGRREIAYLQRAPIGGRSGHAVDDLAVSTVGLVRTEAHR